MEEDRPSATSYRVAVRRAAHQILDVPPVFEDPLALAILGAERGAALRSNLEREETTPSRSLRAFIAVRSRYAEDEMAQAFGSGVRQAVILGAGLDTFAYRNPFPGLRAFEVDHPATQAWKRRRLAEAQIAIPDSVTLVPVDFERQTLAAELARAGFETSRAAFFSWLGVTPYLTEGAILATLGFVASLPAGSGIVFDYAIPPESLSFWQRRAYEALASRVAAHGEPFRTFFDPPTLADQLHQLGFGAIEDLGAKEINERYFQGRSDGLRIAGEMGHLLAARV